MPIPAIANAINITGTKIPAAIAPALELCGSIELIITINYMIATYL